MLFRSNPAIGILCVTKHNVFLVLTIRYPLFGLFDRVELMWENTLTIQSFVASLLTGIDQIEQRRFIFNSASRAFSIPDFTNKNGVTVLQYVCVKVHIKTISGFRRFVKGPIVTIFEIFKNFFCKSFFYFFNSTKSRHSIYF